MLKRQFAFAAIVAAILSVGTAKAAAAQTSCYETCSNAYGDSFYTPTYIMDDFGNIGGPGDYYLTGCYESGGTTVCEYTNYN